MSKGGIRLVALWLLIAAAVFALGGCADDSAPRVVAGEGAVASDDAPESDVPAAARPRRGGGRAAAQRRTGRAEGQPRRQCRQRRAGRNGSDAASARGAEKLAAPIIHPPAGLFPVERSAILLGGTAIAPPSAPGMRSRPRSAPPTRSSAGPTAGAAAAPPSVGRLRLFGRGRATRSGGGSLDIPRTSGELIGWGVPGPGKLDHRLREPGPHLRGDRRAALGHRRRRQGQRAPLAPL